MGQELVDKARGPSMMFSRAVFSIACMATVAIALYPDLKLPTHRFAAGHSDLLYHMAAFAGLTVLAGGACQLRPPLLIFLALLAIGIEAAQIPMPGRRAESLDLAASFIGLALGVSAVWLIRLTRSRRLRVG